MSSYPITDHFLSHVGECDCVVGLSMPRIGEVMAETIMEYEHGTADVADVLSVGRTPLEQYAAVCSDIYLSLHAEATGT